MAINKFIPTSPDENIQSDSDLATARFGHLNKLVDDINNLEYTTPFAVISSTTGAATLRIFDDGTVVNYGPGGNFKNTAFGYAALLNTTSSANGNTAIGAYALTLNTTGVRNTAVGTFCLDNNLTGCCNAAMGQEVLETSESGSENVSIGFRSLKYSTGNSSITALGSYAGFDLLTGGSNTFVGHSAGRGITSGANNTIIGRATGLSSTLSNNIILADGSGNKRLTFDNTGAISLSTTAVTNETVTSDATLVVTINGVNYKLLLQAI